MIDAATGYRPEDVSESIRLKCRHCDKVGSMPRPRYLAKGIACIVTTCPEHFGPKPEAIEYEDNDGAKVTENGERI